MTVHLQSFLVLTLLMLVNTSTKSYQTACSANVSCGSSITQCCLQQYANDPAPMCAPLAQKGDQCTERIVILVRGEPVVLTKVFTGYCPCSWGLSCTGNETKYCT